MTSLQEEDDYRAALAFILYHLIFSKDAEVRKYDGHTPEEWERYKSKTSDALLRNIDEVLEWAIERPDEDFVSILQPATDLKSATIYSYLVKFRKSIDRNRVETSA